ncbi:GntR family transcriptional regulator [Aquimarina sp. D1M17]|uniref:GntR family transcriptional regulator n=1 Tax=Aquimarina acroporae TaxID=2937283 RepID=UPI0020C06712|nr:GntR family transcriptional regulator [Aquimarina acroporae]MCK8522026.1 GntR family transcriptional regulator [Aquimarina acroporae]
MDFDNGKPIYLQIVDFFYENILIRKWQENERIPSVREVAVTVEVNPNTAIRAFNHLQEQEVIYNKRGIGYFVSEKGYDTVLEIKKKEFMGVKLPNIFKEMMLLDVEFEEVKHSYDEYVKNVNDEKK